MILVLISAMCVALLPLPITATKQFQHPDYTRFCDEFNKIPQHVRLLPSSPHSAPAFGEILRINAAFIIQGLYRSLKYLKPNNESYVKQVLKRCTDDPSYQRVECLLAKRLSMMVNNPDWDLMKGKGELVLSAYTDLWRLQPVMRACARRQIALPSSKYDIPKRILNGLQGRNVTAFSAIFRKSPSKTQIRQEIETICKSEDPAVDVCRDLLAIIRLTDAYQMVKNERPTSAKWKAYQLHFVMFRESNPAYRTVMSQEKSKSLIESNAKQIFTYANNWQTQNLRNMVNLFPKRSPHLICSTVFLLHLNPPRERKELCLLWKIVIQINDYLKSTVPMAHGHERKILNTQIDYPTFLKMTEMNGILNLVRVQGTALTRLAQWVVKETKKDVSSRFKDLRDYFRSVESFSRKKSKADVAFLKGRLDGYKEDVKKQTEELKKTVGFVIKETFTAIGVELLEKTVKLGLAFAVLFNPLEKIFGGTSGIEVMDRAADIANSFTDLNRLDRVKVAFDEIRTSMTSISKKLGENGKFLENLKKLIDEDGNSIDFETRRERFLAGYKDYDPKVKRPELTAMTTKYDNLIDEACDVIRNTNTVAGNAAKSKVINAGCCSKAKETAAKLFETYVEIYDFQFELVEAMAAYMRASNAHNAASYISADYEQLSKGQGQNIVNELQTLTFLSFVSYKVNIWGIAESYCDILTYKEGKTPAVCSLNQRSVASLVSHISLKCKDLDGVQNVPISSSNDQGFLDLPGLYAGKEVTFQIPSSQWLVTNGWIARARQNASIVVKKFKVFLPTQSTGRRPVSVTTKALGGAKLLPTSKTSYVLVPSKDLISDYYEGADSERSCVKVSNLLINPYGLNLPKMCNRDVNDCQPKSQLFPSIYSRWKISVHGYESIAAPRPTPQANFRLKVWMRLCISQPQNRDQEEEKMTEDQEEKMTDDQEEEKTDDQEEEKTVGKKKNKEILKDRERKSCPKPKYWSIDLGQCVDCPKGSTSELDGYFCAKNTN